MRGWKPIGTRSQISRPFVGVSCMRRAGLASLLRPMPHLPVTWRDHVRYRFENTLSKGAIAIIGWLAVVSAGIVLLAAAVLAALRIGADPNDPERPLGAVEGAWQSLMHAIDPGTLAGDQGWGLRILMLAVTIGGIFIVSVLIGTITSGLES